MKTSENKPRSVALELAQARGFYDVKTVRKLTVARSILADRTGCDGVDSDCDGRIDEAYVPAEIECGVGLCRAVGVTVCADGAVIERCDPFVPVADNTCDSLDEDCDGLSDEGAEPFAVECG